MKKWILFLLCFGFLMTGMSQRDSQLRKLGRKRGPLSPVDFGLLKAESDTERYDVLYRTYQAALELDKEVSFEGIDTLHIEIPQNAHSIPLTRHNDFGGLVLYVNNHARTQFIFARIGSADTLAVDSLMLAARDFSSDKLFRRGNFMLFLEDENPWVATRSGHDYGAIRRDIVLLHDGLWLNEPVASYQTAASKPHFLYREMEEENFVFRNLTVIRQAEATFKSKVVKITYQNNVNIDSVLIITPKSSLTADGAFTLENCANVYFEDVTIDGTYSQNNYYGYGIYLDNILNSKFVRLTARANWGVFGTNNMNEVLLQDCDINRFDIHCYGKNVKIVNCLFSKLYNQFSSMYGTVEYDSCRFTNFIPVLLEPSYNAYTGFDLVFKNCTFDATKERNFLISAGTLSGKTNARPELAKHCWPNVTIENLLVTVPDNVENIEVFHAKDEQTAGRTVGYISQLAVDGLNVRYRGDSHSVNLVLSDKKVALSKNFRCDLQRLNLIPVADDKIPQAKSKYKYPYSVALNMYHQLGKDVVKIANSRIFYNVVHNADYSITFDNCTLGMVRYTSEKNEATRTYHNCKIYLNCNDDKRYYIDNHATYDGCVFIPCNPKTLVDFWGNNNAVTIKNCKARKAGPLLFNGRSSNEELKGMSVKGDARKLLK